MRFLDLHARLVDGLRFRLSNGELTERALARRLGLSQPHIHNVLNGRRMFSLKMADQILDQLGLSVLDLLEKPGIGGPKR
jgi:plasmid maintenance system antidote protein VapI